MTADRELLATACEQFLGKTVDEIKYILMQTMEGHLRSILGLLLLQPVALFVYLKTRKLRFTLIKLCFTAAVETEFDESETLDEYECLMSMSMKCEICSCCRFHILNRLLHRKLSG